MDPTSDTRSDDELWIDGEGELRWEAVTRMLGFVIAVGVLVAAIGVWLLVSGHLLDGLCQTSKANTEKALLDACQARLDDSSPQLSALADSTRPAAVALAGSVGAVLVLGTMLLLGAHERTRTSAARFDAPAIWTTRVLVSLAALATFWLAVVSIQQLLSVRALL